MGDYGAPLFLAWQLTNRCTGSCLHCCEESGPEKTWPDELDRKRALRLAEEIVELGIPYVAFGGGEPLGVPHAWEVFEILTRGGTELKLETNGLDIDDARADFLQDLKVACVQISIDGASAAVHERLRPGSGYAQAWAAIDRLVRRGLEPELVFIPNRINIQDAPEVFRQAAHRGIRTFVTGPMMRLGRAAEAWDALACTEDDWARTAETLKREEARLGKPRLACYPWGIQKEMLTRLESPQAMTLVVPNGRVKLLNALPFAAGDLKKESLMSAWPKVARAWASPTVRDFVMKAQTDPTLLRHANECWDLVLDPA